jgi:hypothetical protein
MHRAPPIAAAAVLALAALLSTAHAATPESVDRLLQVMKVQSQLETMMSRTLPAMQQSMRESMLAAMRQAMGDQFDPERARRMFDNVQARVDPMLRELMSWEQLKPDLVAIYSETFTQEEIDGLAAFYDTPLGRALVDKMPEVTQRSVQLMQRRLAPMMQRVMQISKEAVLEELANEPPRVPAPGRQ